MQNHAEIEWAAKAGMCEWKEERASKWRMEIAILIQREGGRLGRDRACEAHLCMGSSLRRCDGSESGVRPIYYCIIPKKEQRYNFERRGGSLH